MTADTQGRVLDLATSLADSIRSAGAGAPITQDMVNQPNAIAITQNSASVSDNPDRAESAARGDSGDSGDSIGKIGI
ncbi:hypothetical protein DWB77_07223 [Streptomyces hundungensis]|uniref:Uncharacterized protein n=1 Tax=Streptomyces hundungensis TaxID=1077946 RepID=A0A387HT08_9ACTN|nr:hypothetical protein [Streptomyces hundungensis]AYG85007.1 hypothetical protein DWB77_07223 [Streptomyces hundungensis]